MQTHATALDFAQQGYEVLLIHGEYATLQGSESHIHHHVTTRHCRDPPHSVRPLAGLGNR